MPAIATADAPPQLFTIDEAADRLGMGKSTLYRLVRDKRVPCVKIAGCGVKFTADDLTAIIQMNRRPAVPR